MKNNKGFIAISLIYSFFLVFLVALIASATDYAKNRILLSDVKKETQNYLDDLVEFNPIRLEKDDYAVGEELVFGADTWVVYAKTATEFQVILKRPLTDEEIQKGLSESGIADNARFNNQSRMCLQTYDPIICSYEENCVWVSAGGLTSLSCELDKSNPYNWNGSIVKRIVENWFENYSSLKKAQSLQRIVEMEFSDGVNTTKSYIRIPLSSESAIVSGISDNMWYLTKMDDESGEIEGRDYKRFKEIHPIITIKKIT